MDGNADGNPVHNPSAPPRPLIAAWAVSSDVCPPCFNARLTNAQPWWLAMPVAEVAATILPLFSHSAYQQDWMAMNNIVNWCKTGSYSGRGAMPNPFTDPDHCAVAEAIQVLERAGLLLRNFRNDCFNLGLTRLGMHALQTNTVRQHLGLSDATPTGLSGSDRVREHIRLEQYARGG